jgi:DNA-binding NarL/FixJ family response regulator
MSAARIRVLLADDQQLFAESLGYVIQASAEDVELVGTARDGEAAVEMALSLKPDVILMDVKMPRMDGVEACRRILEKLPETKIAMLSTFPDEEYRRSALRHGAKAYLIKNLRPRELLEAIRALARGAVLVPGETLLGRSSDGEGPGERIPEARDGSPMERLSKRERDLCALMLRSFSNKEIAQRLYLSEQTVRNYISSMYFKLGVKDRFEFMRLMGGAIGDPTGPGDASR